MEQRAFALFKELIELPADAQATALAAIAEPDVRDRVAALLARDAAASALDRALIPGVGGRLATQLANDVEAPALDAPPERVGSYRILRLIGSGGMGLVYEAEQEHPRRHVALKTAHAWLRSRADRERFRAEVEAIGGLLHPAIPQVYEVVESAGATWLAMELVVGQAADRATSGWSVFRRAALLRQLAEATAHAHAHGLVHGDIKPANVLVNAAGAPKLLDFGLATRPGAQDPGGGTAGYRSPGQEVEAGLPPDVRTDVFALGRLGRRLIPDAPPDLDAILTLATRDPRADRYADAAAMADDLGRFLRTEPVRARAPTARYRATRFIQRNRSWVAGFGLAAALAASLTVAVTAAAWGLDRLREARAETAYAGLRARMAVLEAAGDREAADAAFDTFVALQEYVGTRVVGRAWLDRGLSRTDPTARLDALAEAWMAATDEDTRRAALIGMAAEAMAIPDLTLLSNVVGQLTDPPPDLAVAAAAARGDLVAASEVASPFAAMLGPLSYGQPLPAIGMKGRPLRRPDSLWIPTSDHIVILDRDGPHPGPRYPAVPDATLTWLVGEGHPLLARDRPEGATQTLWDLERGQELLGGAGPRTLSAEAWGERALVGFAPSDDHGALRVLPSGGGPGTSVDPELDALGSSVEDLAWVDLDGDGQDELVAALGPWRAFGVRVWRVVDGRLVPIGDLRLGNVHDLLPFRGRDGRRRVAVVKDDLFGSAEVFGDARPDGEPAAVYVLGWHDGPAVVAAARWGTSRRFPYGMVAADLDADGADELLATGIDGGSWLLRQTESGLDGVFLGGIWVWGAAQLDDDPADELLVGSADRSLSVLGAGTTRKTGSAPRAPPTRPADDAGAADALASVGLHTRAASRLRFLAGLEAGDEAAALLVHAAETSLAATPPASAAAAEALEEALRVAVDPDLRRHAATLLATVALDRHAWERLERWLPEADPHAIALAGAATQLEAWRAAPPVAVPAEASGWQVLAPESAPPGEPGVIRAFANHGALWTLPVHVTGAAVAIEADLDVRRLEVGGRLELLLRQPGGAPVLEAYVAALGGGGRARLHLGCSFVAEGSVIRGAIVPDAVGERVRIGATAVGDRRWCDVSADLAAAKAPPLAPGDYELVLAAGGPDWPASQFAEARVLAVRGRGFTVGTPARSVGSPFVEAVYDQDPLAMARALPELLRRPDGDAQVRSLLRTDHRALLPVLQAVAPAALPGLLGRAWSMQAREVGLHSTRDLLDEPVFASLRATDSGWLRLQRQRARLARTRGLDGLAAPGSSATRSARSGWRGSSIRGAPPSAPSSETSRSFGSKPATRPTR